MAAGALGGASGRKKIAEAWVEIKPSMQGFFTAMSGQMNSQLASMSRSINASLSRAGSSSSKSFSRNFSSGASRLSSIISAPFKGVASVGMTAGRTAAKAFSSAISAGTKGIKIGAGIAAAGAGLAAAKVGSSGISRALNIEDAKAKLEALRFTGEQISKITENAMASVKGTAYGFDEAMTTSVSALAAGIKEGAQLQNYLKLIADTATVSGAGLDEVGYIFNKISANTRAYSEELNMLADRGIPVYAWLAKELKVSQEELRKMIKGGQITSKVFLDTMAKNLGGAATTATSTTRGYVANFNAALARLGEGLLGGSLPVLTKILKELIPLVDAFTAASKASGASFWERIDAKIIPPLEKWVDLTIKNVEAGKSMFPFFDRVKGFAGFILNIVNNLKSGLQVIGEWKAAFADSDFGKGFLEFGSKLGGFFSEWGSQAKEFITHLKPIGQIWQEFIMPAIMPFWNLIVGLLPVIQGLAQGILAIVIPLRDFVFSLVSQIADALTGAGEGGGFQTLGSTLKSIGELLGSLIKDYGPLVGQLVQTIATGLGGVIANVFPRVIEVVKTLIDTVAGFLPLVSEVFPIIAGVVQDFIMILLDVINYLAVLAERYLPYLITGIGPILAVVVAVLKGVVRAAGILIEAATFIITAISNGLTILVNAIFGIINLLGGSLQYLELDDFQFDRGVLNIGDGYQTDIYTGYGMATGGTVKPVMGGTVVRLAEAGKPETVVDTGLINKHLANSNRLMDSSDGSKPTIINNINVTTTGEVDENKLSQLIERKIRRSSAYY